MKFIQIITPHDQEEMNDIIMSMTPTETDYVINLYHKISMVEYTDQNGCECMFAILDDLLLEKVTNLYKRYTIEFRINDLTTDVICDNFFNTKYKNYLRRPTHKQTQKLIKEFKLNWVSKDDILDKILEKGISSLTKLDFQILKS